MSAMFATITAHAQTLFARGCTIDNLLTRFSQTAFAAFRAFLRQQKQYDNQCKNDARDTHKIKQLHPHIFLGFIGIMIAISGRCHLAQFLWGCAIGTYLIYAQRAQCHGIRIIRIAERLHHCFMYDAMANSIRHHPLYAATCHNTHIARLHGKEQQHTRILTLFADSPTLKNLVAEVKSLHFTDTIHCYHA